jgi:hypothetical protein
MMRHMMMGGHMGHMGAGMLMGFMLHRILRRMFMMLVLGGLVVAVLVLWTRLQRERQRNGLDGWR